MIIGAHSIVYSMNADADRAFFRDVLKLGSIDMGGGWLIFGLPPAEVAVHPSDRNDVHEFYLMCEDVEELVEELETRGVAATPVSDHGWGLVVHVTLPGGGKLGIYEPRHPRPVVSESPSAKKSTAGRAGGRASKAGSKTGKKSAATRKPAKVEGKTSKKKAGKVAKRAKASGRSAKAVQRRR